MPAGAGKQKAAWRANMRLRRVSQSPENRSAGVGEEGSVEGGGPAAPRNSQTYFSNLWTDNKSTLRPGQRVIHQREMAANWATMRQEQDEVHICTEVTLRARVRTRVHGQSICARSLLPNC